MSQSENGDGDQDSKKILATFKSKVDISLQKNRHRECAPGTGTWFFDHPSYGATIQTPASQLLVVTAEAGGGKSTVMRTLVDKLAELGKSSTVAFFFFKKDDDTLSSYTESLRSLLYQILDQQPHLRAHIKELHESHRDVLKNDTNLMWKCLSNVALNGQHDMYCLLDAVDECNPKGRARLREDLTMFYRSDEHVKSRLKFIVSSRPLLDEQFFNSLPEVTRFMQGEETAIRSDIKSLINFSAENLVAKYNVDPSARELIAQKVTAQNDSTRSFLAIRATFELLDTRFFTGLGPDVIEEIVDELPPSLDSLLESTLEKSPSKEHTRRLLSVVLAARRTIKLDEFKAIYSLTEQATSGLLSITLSSKPYYDFTLAVDDDTFKDLVRARCGPFITFVGNSVHLFHQSAREYFLKREDQGPTQEPESKSPVISMTTPLSSVVVSNTSSWRAPMTKQDAHLVCAEACLIALNLAVEEQNLSESFQCLETGANQLHHSLKEMMSSKPFYLYMALNWLEHIKLAGEKGIKLLVKDVYRSMLDVSKPQFWMWFLTAGSYIFYNSPTDPSPVFGPWQSIDKYKSSYGIFLREYCLKRSFQMDHRLQVLLDTSAPSQSDSMVEWKVDGGFHLVDKFHTKVAEFEYTSFVRAMKGIEEDDWERASMFPIGTHTLIWASIILGAPKALRHAMDSTTDILWLDDISDDIIRYSETWGANVSRRRSKADKRTTEWPGSFFILFQASLLDNEQSLFEVLGEWVEKHPEKEKVSQGIWQAGGFISSTLCHRLVQSGASISSQLWPESGSAIHVAAAFRKHDAIRALLELGADPAQCVGGRNVLHDFAIHIGSSLLSATFPRGDDKHPAWGKVGQLHLKSEIQSSLEKLVHSTTDGDRRNLLNQPCEGGMTPLMLAVVSNRPSPTTVRTLLEQGANVNHQDDIGRTAALIFLQADGFVNRPTIILEHLIRAGADVDICDASGSNVMGRYTRMLTSTQLSYFYTGSNAYNRAFKALVEMIDSAASPSAAAEIKGFNVPLVIAARLGNARMCLALLAAGANPSHHGMEAVSVLKVNSGSVSSDLADVEWNPLMVALSSKAYVTAALLVEHGADVGFTTRKRKKGKYNGYRVRRARVTPLHAAISGGGSYSADKAKLSLDVVDSATGCAFLPAARPDHPITDTFKNRKLRNHLMACRCGLAKRRQAEKSPEESKYETADHRSSNDWTGADLLPYDSVANIQHVHKGSNDDRHLATIYDPDSAASQRRESLIELMLERGAPVNAQNVQKVTPLALSVRRDEFRITEILLHHGADPNIPDSGGSTPLMSACREGKLELVDLLLRNGADPNSQTKGPRTPDTCRCTGFVHFQNWTWRDCDAPLTPLVLAAEAGHRGVVERLLDGGADPNMTVVHHAHGKLPARRSRKSGPASRQIVGDESDEDAEQEEKEEVWTGLVGVATALTWARGEMRELLLARGAREDVEEPVGRCGCVVEGGGDDKDRWNQEKEEDANEDTSDDFDEGEEDDIEAQEKASAKLYYESRKTRKTGDVIEV